MKKRALPALLLAMMMLLSGCALIVRDEAVDMAREVVRVGDVAYTKGDVQAQVDYSLSYMQMLYSMYGMSYDVTDPEIIAGTRQSVVDSLTEQAVLTVKAKELGMDQLTADEQAQLDQAVENTWQEYRDSVALDIELGENTTEAEAEAMIDEICAAEGVSIETVRESELLSLMNEKLQAYAIKDVTVSEDEVRAAFETEAAADQTAFAADPSSYGAALLNGGTVYYAPAGYRYVKQILIQFTDEDTAAIEEIETTLAAAETEEDTAALEVQLAAETAQALQNIDPVADEVLTRLAAGEDWDALAAEYNDDPGMMEGSKFAVTGYPVCEGFTQFDPVFVQAAMGIQNVGEWSDKAAGSYGYYIIQYTSDIPEGPVDFETVRADFEADLLAVKQDEAYAAAIESWVSQADVKINMDVLND